MLARVVHTYPSGKLGRSANAQSPFFYSELINATIISMALLAMLIQVLGDGVRGIVMDLLGRRAEQVVDKWLKKWRLQRGKNRAETRKGYQNDSKSDADS